MLTVRTVAHILFINSRYLRFGGSNGSFVVLINKNIKVTDFLSKDDKIRDNLLKLKKV